MWPKPGWIVTDEFVQRGAGQLPDTCPVCGKGQTLPAVFPKKEDAVWEIIAGDVAKRGHSELNTSRCRVIVAKLCSAS